MAEADEEKQQSPIAAVILIVILAAGAYWVWSSGILAGFTGGPSNSNFIVCVSSQMKGESGGEP